MKKNDKTIKLIAASCAFALTFSAGAALLATSVDASLLRKLFGGFLILVGITELFGAHARDKKAK